VPKQKPQKKKRGSSIYLSPSLDGHLVPYKGKRFLVIQIDKDRPFDFVTKELADFTIFDKKFGVVIANISKIARGRLLVSLMSHVSLEYTAKTIRDAVRIAERQMEWYSKAIS
jgi:hypothetical protein